VISADSATYGHKLSITAPAYTTEEYVATPDGVEHIHSSGDQPWDTEKTIECTCGETFETEADGKAHIKEKATGVTADQYRAIANEAKGTTLYGFKCLD